MIFPGIYADGSIAPSTTAASIRTSMGIGAADSVTFGGLSVSDLTTGRVPYLTTSGRLIDSANFKFNGSNLEVVGAVVLYSGGEFAQFTSNEFLGAISSPFIIAHNTSGQPLVFKTNSGAGRTERARIDSSGNFGLKQTSFGTSAVGVFAIGNGTAPSTAPADCFQLYAADQVAGNSCPHYLTENGALIKLFQAAHINDPSAGGTQDAEARTAIGSILDLLEANGLMAT